MAADAQLHLRVVARRAARQSGLPQRLGSLPQALEIFLEGEVGGLEVTAGRHQLGYRLDHRQSTRRGTGSAR